MSASMNAHKQNGNSSLLRGRTERIDLSRGGEHVTRAETGKILHSFPQALRMFSRQHQDEEFEYHKV